MLARFYGITEGVRAVSDGESLDLGGKTLRFFHIPFVHWPETMATYEETQKVLFSCDAFGGFRALDGVLFDDEVDVAEYEDEALRYFSNIVGMQSKAVLRAIEKLAGLAIEVIAPSHGPVWRRNPRHIVELYFHWERVEALGWELVGEVSFHGTPTPEDLARARELGRKVAERVGAAAPEA